MKKTHNPKKRIINSVKKWDDDGTCYRQGVHITAEEYDKLLDILRTELIIPKNDDYYFNFYLKQPLDKKNNIVFLNLTQRDFFNRWLKAPLRNDNTYLIINQNNNMQNKKTYIDFIAKLNELEKMLLQHITGDKYYSILRSIKSIRKQLDNFFTTD